MPQPGGSMSTRIEHLTERRFFEKGAAFRLHPKLSLTRTGVTSNLILAHAKPAAILGKNARIASKQFTNNRLVNPATHFFRALSLRHPEQAFGD
jgi:hypothetical protein